MSKGGAGSSSRDRRYRRADEILLPLAPRGIDNSARNGATDRFLQQSGRDLGCKKCGSRHASSEEAGPLGPVCRDECRWFHDELFIVVELDTGTFWE